jgi:hypothetical protein
MKKLFLPFSGLLLFAIAGKAQLFNKNAIITYGICFVAGASDGVNDAIVAHDPFSDSEFWSLYAKDSYENKEKYGWLRREVLTFTTDGYHLTKFVTYTSYTVAIGFTIGDKNRNWKYIIEKAALSFVATKLGHTLTYNVLFK